MGKNSLQERSIALFFAKIDGLSAKVLFIKNKMRKNIYLITYKSFHIHFLDE